MICASLLLAFLAGCHPSPPKDAFAYDLPGPTLMAKVAGGYELKNRHVRAVIDEKTGDLIAWGPADGSTDVLCGRPLRACLDGIGVSVPDGYVEKRDDQTWQYLGEDKPNAVGWRKIYCLEGDSLFVSFLMQNQRPTPRPFLAALLPADSPAFVPTEPAPTDERFDARATSAAGKPINIHFLGFNERHDTDERDAILTRAATFPTTRAATAQSTRPAPFVLLVSDPHPLKPGERISWTMQWWMSVPSENEVRIPPTTSRAD